KAAGDDIACSVARTWTAEEMRTKVLKGRFTWPFGNAQCSTDINLPRKTLARLFAGGEIELRAPKHRVTCTLDQKDGKDKYSISFSVQPVVKFNDGKAVKARINWSGIQGSVVARGAVWPTAKLDNYAGIFDGLTIDGINDFFGLHCNEVRSD